MSECVCGCGLPAPIAKRTRPYLGHVLGEPRPYRPGHYARVNPPNRSLVPYRFEDRGHGTPCWIWNGAPKNHGYCMVGEASRRRYAHRVIYERFLGAIPDGLHIDHLCRVRNCVNPAHLEPVTIAENNRRGRVARGLA